MSALLLDPLAQAIGGDRNVLSGAKLYVYVAGTTTDATVYTDNGETTPHAQPVVGDSSGRFAPIYAPAGVLYKIVLQTSADVTILTVDDIVPYIASGGATLPISGGGTNSTTAGGALTALGAASASDLTTLNSTVSAISAGQSQTVWNTGTSTTEGVISPAKLTARIADAVTAGPTAMIWHQTGPTVSGGSLTAGSWVTRPLTHEYDPETLCPRTSNTFTPAVSGWVEWECATHGTLYSQSRLYNVTDTASTKQGSTTYSATSSGVLTGISPVEAAKQYRIEHRSFGTSAIGMGVPASFDEDNIHLQIKFYKDVA